MRVQVAERQKPLLQVELSQNSVLQATLFQLANITLVVFAQGLQIHFLFLLVHFLFIESSFPCSFQSWNESKLHHKIRKVARTTKTPSVIFRVLSAAIDSWFISRCKTVISSAFQCFDSAKSCGIPKFFFYSN